MNPSVRYDVDYLGWLEEQASRLRAGQLDQLDRRHLLEELEGMSCSEHRQLRNRLIVLVLHLLKWRHQPDHRSPITDHRSPSWSVTIITQRVDIGLLLRDSPSLRPTLETALEQTYPKARQEAAEETGWGVTHFPATCPFTIADVLNEDFWPDAGERDGS